MGERQLNHFSLNFKIIFYQIQTCPEGVNENETKSSNFMFSKNDLQPKQENKE